MSANVRVSGTYRKATEIHTKVSGTWRNCLEGWVRVAGTWRKFFPDAFAAGSGDWSDGGSETVNNVTATPTNAVATIVIKNDGSYDLQQTGAPTVTKYWHPSGGTVSAAEAAQYEFQWTNTTGPTGLGAASGSGYLLGSGHAFQTINSDFEWTNTMSTGSFTGSTWDFQIEIRHKNDTSDSATQSINLDAFEDNGL